jgi:hypothetical protein
MASTTTPAMRCIFELASNLVIRRALPFKPGNLWQAILQSAARMVARQSPNAQRCRKNQYENRFGKNAD